MFSNNGYDGRSYQKLGCIGIFSPHFSLLELPKPTLWLRGPQSRATQYPCVWCAGVFRQSALSNFMEIFERYHLQQQQQQIGATDPQFHVNLFGVMP